jgi:CDP-glucose 4,6-dehydratase
MEAAFWKDKRVLITGHTGFKGSWLSLWLQRKGTRVIGFALPPPTTPSFFEIGELASSMVSIEGDVRDLMHLVAVIENHKPEILIHMAAQSLVRYSYQHPLETYETNVMGTLNVLEAIRQTQTVRAALIITSDKCYKNDERAQGYRESDAMGGNDPYSSSKGCAELVTAAYCNSFLSEKESSEPAISIASARAGNVIGGGDWSADRLIPDIVRAVINNKTLVIRNPNAIRPWQHVLEPLNGYLVLIENLWTQGSQFEGGWNFGPIDDDCKPVDWILKAMNNLWEGGIQWELDTAENPSEASFLKVDSSKARNLLGWSTKLSVNQALCWVVRWYQGYLNKENMRRLSEEQIQRYEELNQP